MPACVLPAASDLDVSGGDARALVVACGVSGQLEDLGGEVFKDGREVDGGAASDAGSVASLAEETRDASHGELQAGAGRARLRLASGLLAASSLASRFASARHVDE